MYDFPKDKTRVKQRIAQYERSLREEKRRFGGIMDSAGKRYLLGALYLLNDDVSGALRSFEWFENEFQADIGEPFNICVGR